MAPLNETFQRKRQSTNEIIPCTGSGRELYRIRALAGSYSVYGHRQEVIPFTGMSKELFRIRAWAGSYSVYGYGEGVTPHTGTGRELFLPNRHELFWNFMRI